LRWRRLVVDNVRDAHIVGELQKAKMVNEPNKVNPIVEAWSDNCASRRHYERECRFKKEEENLVVAAMEKASEEVQLKKNETY
jgi:hypothetical protein